MNYNYKNNPNNTMQNYYRRFPNYYGNDQMPGSMPGPMPGPMPPLNNQMPGPMPPFNNQRQTPPGPIATPMPGPMPPANNQMAGPLPPFTNQPMQPGTSIEDQGPEPFSVDLTEATLSNSSFRQTLWTGEYFQVTVMSIEVDGEIGYEVHPDFDQLLYIEQGEGLVVMGDSMDNLNYQESVYEGYVVIIPAGEYHNLLNEGNVPLKLFSVYAPPAHPPGTVHETYEEAIEAEEY